MRIRERYPFWMKVYSGRGLSRLSLPFRYIASKVYDSYVTGTAHEIPVRRSRSGTQDGAMIVSVGNLEAGGGGKTPFVIAIAEELRKRGGVPVIVTRGYRSEAERRGPFVVTGSMPIDDEALSFIETEGLGERMIGGLEQTDLGFLSRTVGDEPTLFASRDIPTVISRDRERGIRIARRLFGPKHIILDDAFQNRSVERDLDILLLDWNKPFGDGRLIPLGSLRERPVAVGRADCIIFTRAGEERAPIEARDLIEGKPVFYSRHTAIDLIGADGEILSLEHLSGQRVALFSGIARPGSFEETVSSIGADPVISFRFADHHLFRRRDIRWMEREIERGFPIVTTEKDLAKAAGLFTAGTRLLALRMRMEVKGIDSLIGLLDPQGNGSSGD
jgi:tetraacyldisaccharide 4'-kinase